MGKSRSELRKGDNVNIVNKTPKETEVIGTGNIIDIDGFGAVVEVLSTKQPTYLKVGEKKELNITQLEKEF